MDVDKIASLAKLALTREEKLQFETDIEEVLESFKVLEQWDASVDAKEGHFVALEEDEVISGMSQQQSLNNVTYSKDGFVIAPATTK
jgi:aspartyl/glutamyl-tRNA(Asn/Gln) amidotransferase C subunit